MKKKIMYLLLCCLLTAALCGFSPRDLLNQTAESIGIPQTETTSEPSSGAQSKQYLTDNAGLLSPQEEAKLEARLAELSAQYSYDIAILTVNTLNGRSPRDYADNYYERRGYGQGERRDGSLLLVSMQDRDYWFSTCGRGEDLFSNETIWERLETPVREALSDGKYYQSFSSFAELTAVALEKGKIPRSGMDLMIMCAIIIGVSCVISGLIVAGMAHGMNTVRQNNLAADYAVAGSLSIRDRQDMFLFRNVIRTKKTPPPSSGSGGASGHHTSSSGTSHGGRGGKF